MVANALGTEAQIIAMLISIIDQMLIGTASYKGSWLFVKIWIVYA